MSMYNALAIALCLFFCCLSSSAQNDVEAEQEYPTKRIQAVKITNPPVIDGDWSDPVWSTIEAASDFTAFEPNPDTIPKYKTYVKVAYTDDALYLAAFMKDENPEMIPQQLGYRDAIGANADYLCLFLDTYDDGQNGYSFCLSVSDIQSDARYSPSEGENWLWNGIWFSSTQVTEDGWYCEMKIPYYSIRFPKKDIQTWGINFWRNFRRDRERSSWQRFDLNGQGFVNQWGKLEGLKDLDPPIRLSLTPYISAGIDYLNDKPEGTRSSSTFIRGGADIKYGINESFTLDMTLIPDFGQVQSDDQVLNLSPFEVFFDENRSFFLEGTDLFSRGNIFYSRRVGGRPLLYWDVEDGLSDSEIITSNPIATQLLNATKISGRTTNGSGLGFFNAVTAATNATVLNEETGSERTVLTNPLTNYNVVVMDKPLANNSYVSLTNTNVIRNGRYRDANVTAIITELNNKKRTYAISGFYKHSQLFNSNHEKFDDIVTGSSYNIVLKKTSGKLQGGIGHYVETDTYNPNDLGFLRNNNERNTSGWINYNINEPFWKINGMWNNWGFNYNQLYNPNEFTGFSIWGSNGLSTDKFLSMGINYGLSPVEGNDFFEPRVDGRVFKTYPGGWFNYWFSSDYRKRFALDGGAGVYRRPFTDEYTYDFWFKPIFRVNDKLLLSHEYIDDYFDEIGFTDVLEDDDPLFARREVFTVINTSEASYIFTSTMALDFRMRHYWRKVLPYEFRTLNEDGSTSPRYDIESNYDNSVNFFTIDLVYRWLFLPGSEMSFVWKNFIFQSDEEREHTYVRNFNKTINEAASNNNVSLKVVYFVDYLAFKNLASKKRKMPDTF